MTQYRQDVDVLSKKGPFVQSFFRVESHSIEIRRALTQATPKRTENSGPDSVLLYGVLCQSGIAQGP